MFEILFFTILIYLFLDRKKRKRRPRTLDGELKNLISESADSTSIALDIKRYLLNTINDNNNDVEQFSDAQIREAQRIIDRAGPAAFYWMSDIAARLALLSAAQVNNIPTDLNDVLATGVTAEKIVDAVVKI